MTLQEKWTIEVISFYLTITSNTKGGRDHHLRMKQGNVMLVMPLRVSIAHSSLIFLDYYQLLRSLKGDISSCQTVIHNTIHEKSQRISKFEHDFCSKRHTLEKA